MKHFKFVTDEQLTNAARRYRNGGKNKYIYCHEFENGQVETFEVFESDSAFNVFENINEMYQFYLKTGMEGE